MFTQPVGPHLTPEQARELDDDLFSSRPLEYFSSRIASLLATVSATDEDSALGRQFARLLGVTHPGQVLAFTDTDRVLQVAADGYVLRHHVAESLVRLYHALGPPDGANKSSCIWQRLADGPRSTVKLVDAARAHLIGQDGHDAFPSLVLPPGTTLDEDAVTALNVMQDWLLRAMSLLTRHDIDINAGHNKAKHGFAVRTGLQQVVFTKTPLQPGEPVPLDAIVGLDAVDLINGASLDFLSKPAKAERVEHGWEVTTLRLVPPVLLAEAQLMAVTHAALFSLAAARHFDGRPDGQRASPSYPTIPLGPTPGQLLGKSLVGVRRPYTFPASATEVILRSPRRSRPGLGRAA